MEQRACFHLGLIEPLAMTIEQAAKVESHSVDPPAVGNDMSRDLEFFQEEEALLRCWYHLTLLVYHNIQFGKWTQDIHFQNCLATEVTEL
jgi:hypothetical protein